MGPKRLMLCVIIIITTLLLISPKCNDVIESIPETDSKTTRVVELISIETTTAETTTVETTTAKTTMCSIKKETTVVTTKPMINNDKYQIPNNGGKFKSYTNYRLLSKNSPQWNKVQCHPDAYTDANGLRKVGDYYCVAMGSYYSTTLGDLFLITTEVGTFKVILCDFKANRHTDVNNQYTLHNNCMVEFYVDMSTLNSTAKQMGDISYVDNNFEGKIIDIVKIGNYFE